MASEVILKALPFDSREVINQETGEKEYDRVAYSADLANWMKTYFSNGVLVPNGGTISTELQVTASGLTVTVNPGAICINGRTAWVDEATQLTVNMGGSSVRYDRIVAELNLPEDRQIALKVVEGTTNPPSLVRTGDVYQMSLAQVRVNANAAVIASVIDERQDESVCGISNVMVGVKIPAGDSAENIGVSDEVAGIYDLTGNNKNVEKALIAIPDTLATSSYIAFCTKANTDSVESAMGKNNEDFVRGIGRALALYARFKTPSINLKSVFPNLIQKSTLREALIESPAAFTEVEQDSNLVTLMTSYPYSNALYTQAKQIVANQCYLLATYAGLNPKVYTTFSSFLGNATARNAIITNLQALSYALTIDAFMTLASTNDAFMLQMITTQAGQNGLKAVPTGLNYVALNQACMTRIFALTLREHTASVSGGSSGTVLHDGLAYVTLIGCRRSDFTFTLKDINGNSYTVRGNTGSGSTEPFRVTTDVNAFAYPVVMKTSTSATSNPFGAKSYDLVDLL